MSGASRYRGLPVSDGLAAGAVYRAAGGGNAAAGGCPAATAAGVRAAFAAVAQERHALAARLRDQGRGEEAAIVTIGALIAADPALVDPAVSATAAGTDAATAVHASAAAQAEVIAALPDPGLAARAEDVRQVASAVLGQLAGPGSAPPAGPFILVGHDLDPADLIRFAEAGLAGAVSVAGGASSHAAIIARGLGLPMLAGADPAVLTAPGGHPAVLDTAAGLLTVDPPGAALAAAVAHADPLTAVAHAGPLTGAGPAGPPAAPRTADGQAVTLLCNVASAAETRIGLAAGAAGVGLLRTEIPFIRAAGWPSRADHEAQLGPVLSQLGGRDAVVRLLDFSGDKVPAFLAGTPGLQALLRHPRALRDQLDAVLAAAAGARLAVMIPMVRALAEVDDVRAVLASAAAAAGCDPPALGIMVEVAATAAAAAGFAPAVDFFSIGTNDLTSQVLGLDRTDRRARPALAADPRVLALIAEVTRAAGTAGIRVSVCGDAGADPAVLPLLAGLGIRTFSVPAARVGQVAGQLAGLDTGRCADLAAGALRASSVDQVWAQVGA